MAVRRVSVQVSDIPMGMRRVIRRVCVQVNIMSVGMRMVIRRECVRVSVMSVGMRMAVRRVCVRRSAVPMGMGMAICAMQIVHVVVMVLVGLLQPHVKIAGIYAGFTDSCDIYVISVQRKRVQRFPQLFRIRAQVQKRRNTHVAADT